MLADERLRALPPELRERLIALGIICDAQLDEWERSHPAGASPASDPAGPADADIASWCGLIIEAPPAGGDRRDADGGGHAE
jgi:hypothetical protein